VASSADGAAHTAVQLATRRLARAHRRVVRQGARITPETPAEALHDLRKRGKELRYLLEIFSPLCRPEDVRPQIRELKRLQDVLGTFQDTEVQRHAVVALAGAMLEAGAGPATTLMAMGEVAAHLHDDQRGAREEFARRFEAFRAVPPPVPAS
jgi:CHAD domain-containing protein